MSDIQGQILLAENAAGNGFKRLKLDASGRLECSVNEIEITAAAITVAVDGLETLQGTTNSKLDTLEASLTSMEGKQDTQIGHMDGVEASLTAITGYVDGLETLQTAANTDLAAIEVLLTSANTDHAANEALLTTIDADTNDIKTNTAACATDLAALEVLQTSTNSKLDHLSDNQDTLETTLTAIETDTAAIEVLLTAANVDHAANEVLLTNAEAHLGNIETAVQLLDDAIHAEDAAHSSGQKGIPCLMVRQDSHSDLAADGDYMIPTINANGEIRVTSSAASGGSTEAKQDDMETSLDAILAKNTEIDSVLDTIKVDTEAIETATEKLSGVSEAVWLNNATINAQSLGASLNTTGYTKVRLYGSADQSFFNGTSDLVLMGSLTDGGTYFNLGNTATITHDIGQSGSASASCVNCLVESPPKFIKIKNLSGTDNYALTINAKMTHT